MSLEALKQHLADDKRYADDHPCDDTPQEHRREIINTLLTQFDDISFRAESWAYLETRLNVRVTALLEILECLADHLWDETDFPSATEDGAA